MMMNLYNYFSINIMILNNNFFNSLILKNFLDNKINLSKLLDFIELLGSLLIFFIIFYGIYKITVMYSTGSKLSQLLDTTVKLAQIAGGSALTYNALRNSGGGGFGSGNNDNDNNKDDKDKKKDNNNKDNDKTKTKEPISDNNKTTSTPIVNISIIKLLFEINNNKYFLFKNCSYNCLLQFKVLICFINRKIYKNITYKQNSLLLLVLNYFNITIPNNAEPILEFSLGVFLLSLVCFFSFINLIFYLVAIILIKNYDIEKKYKNYPILVKIIKYYTKSTIFVAIIEGIICLICLIILIVMSLLFLGVTFY